MIQLLRVKSTLDNKMDEHESQFNREKDEGIKKILTSSFSYAVKRHDFDVENYFVEDVTEVIAARAIVGAFSSYKRENKAFLKFKFL